MLTLTEKRRRLLIGLVLAACTVMIFAAATAPKAKASIVCDVELSGGVGVAANTLKESGDKVDLAGVGGVAGLGVGCDDQRKSSVVGAMFRASLMSLRGDVGGDTIKQDQLYEAAFRAGIRIHDKYTVYGLAGWSWTKTELPAGLGRKDPNGLLLGGGVDFHVVRNLYARTEYTWHNFNGQDVGGGAKLEQDLHVFRVGAVIKFNDPVNKGISIEDDVPEVKPCDPKMANCGKKMKP